jgi:hypothetical protein
MLNIVYKLQVLTFIIGFLLLFVTYSFLSFKKASSWLFCHTYVSDAIPFPLKSRWLNWIWWLPSIFNDSLYRYDHFQIYLSINHWNILWNKNNNEESEGKLNHVVNHLVIESACKASFLPIFEFLFINSVRYPKINFFQTLHLEFLFLVIYWIKDCLSFIVALFLIFLISSTLTYSRGTCNFLSFPFLHIN